MREWWVLPLCLALVAVGGLLLVVGDRESRLVGLMCVVFFGAAIPLSIAERIPPHPLKPDDQGAVTIYSDGAKMFGIAVAGILAGAGSGLAAALAWQEGNGLIAAVGGLGLILFAGAGVFAFVRGARRQPLVRLTPQRLEVLAGPSWSLAWTEIAAIEPYTVGAEPFIGLHVTPDAKERLGRIGAINAAVGLPRLTFGLQGARVDFDAFLVVLQRYRNAQ